MSFVIDDPKCDFNATTKAPVGVVKPPVTTTPSGETAPVLSLSGSPGLTTVSARWTAAVATSDSTVVGYQFRWRAVTDLAWSGPVGVSDVLAYTTPSGSLTPATAYFAQVRARYSTATDFGPWSNTLAVTTDSP